MYYGELLQPFEIQALSVPLVALCLANVMNNLEVKLGPVNSSLVNQCFLKFQ